MREWNFADHEEARGDVKRLMFAGVGVEPDFRTSII